MVMTLEADYAVRIVEYLTKHPERRDAKTISEETQIPLRFSLKILRELVAEGLVCSFKAVSYTHLSCPTWARTRWPRPWARPSPART